MQMPESHVVWEFMGSATAVAFIGHAVNTFPVPVNPYARWFLSLIQWIVGQRTQAAETRGGLVAKVAEMQGASTKEIVAVINETANPPKTGI